MGFTRLTSTDTAVWRFSAVEMQDSPSVWEMLKKHLEREASQGFRPLMSSRLAQIFIDVHQSSLTGIFQHGQDKNICN